MQNQQLKIVSNMKELALFSSEASHFLSRKMEEKWAEPMQISSIGAMGSMDDWAETKQLSG